MALELLPTGLSIDPSRACTFYREKESMSRRTNHGKGRAGEAYRLKPPLMDEVVLHREKKQRCRKKRRPARLPLVMWCMRPGNKRAARGT